MKEFLKEIVKKNYDSIFFFPTDKDNEVHLEGSFYVNPGEVEEKDLLGKMYHVILFRTNESGGTEDLDTFDAMLLSPTEYIGRLIPENWYGAVLRKTTTSGEITKKLFAKLKEVC